jgi:hypothetical protein
VRGYPTDYVNKWLKDNISERWNQRLDTKSQNNDAEGVLVLKTTYNTAWNYFSAKQLGDTVIGTWRKEIFLSTEDPALKSLQGDERNRYAHPSSKLEALSSVAPELLTRFWTADGVKDMPDIAKLGFLTRRMIVSRKRTKNLFDLTSLWKKTVLKVLEEDILEQKDDVTDEADAENTAEAPIHHRERWSPTRQLGDIDPSVFLA